MIFKIPVIKMILIIMAVGLGQMMILTCDETDEDIPFDSYFKVDDSALNDSMKTHYKEEASRLALREIIDNFDESLNSVVIPEDSIAHYYFALVSVYNQFESSIRDTLIDTFSIKTYPFPTLDRMELYVSSSATWIQPWLNGDVLTGNSYIDSLVAHYSLYPMSISGPSEYSYYYSVSMRTDEYLNMWPLLGLFMLDRNVVLAEVAGFGGDSDDITAYKLENHIYLRYYLKWGDCPAGCIWEHWWEYSVSYQGDVNFIGSGGDSLENYGNYYVNQ